MAGEGGFDLRDQLRGVTCPCCDSTLVPISTAPGPGGLAFGCTEGHVVDLGVLLASRPDAMVESLRTLMKSWEEAIRQMVDGSHMARVRGMEELAERLDRRVISLKGRVQVLQEAVTKAGR